MSASAASATAPSAASTAASTTASPTKPRPVVRSAFVGMTFHGILQAAGNVTGCLFASSAVGIQDAARDGLGIRSNRFQSNHIGIDRLTTNGYSGHVVSGNDFCGQTQFAIQQGTAGAPIDAASNYWGTASEMQAGFEAGDSRWLPGGGTISQLPILLTPATSANRYPGDGNALAAVACTSTAPPRSAPCAVSLNTTWTAAAGPFLCSSLLVSAGAWLTIEAGVAINTTLQVRAAPQRCWAAALCVCVLRLVLNDAGACCYCCS